MDLALNNQQKLICHKTQQTKPNHISLYILLSLKMSLKNGVQGFLIPVPKIRIYSSEN